MDKKKRLAELEQQLESVKQQYHQVLGASMILKEQIKEDEKPKEEKKESKPDADKK